MQQTGYCPRGPFCAFAHVDRKSTNIMLIYLIYLAFSRLTVYVCAVKYMYNQGLDSMDQAVVICVYMILQTNQ